MSELEKTSLMRLLAQYTIVFPAVMQTNPQKYSSTCTHTKPLSSRNHTAWNDSMQNILKATEKAVETSA